LDQRPDRVLAGNIVPFRSPSWSELPDRAGALQFGASLWREVLLGARPRLIVTMGSLAAEVILGITSARTELIEPLAWGTIQGKRATFDGGFIVCLPHLSRFRLFSRPKSVAKLHFLLSPCV
jgi:hypothetical protein